MSNAGENVPVEERIGPGKGGSNVEATCGGIEVQDTSTRVAFDGVGDGLFCAPGGQETHVGRHGGSL